MDLKRHLVTMEIAGDRPPRYGEKNGTSPEGEGLSLAIARASAIQRSRGTGPRATGLIFNLRTQI